MPRDRSIGDGDSPERTIANRDRLVAMGQAVERRHGRARRPRQRRWLRRTLIIVGVVVVLVVAAIVGDYYYLGSLDTKIKVKHLQQSSAASENILLIGSTTPLRTGSQNAAYGLCSQGVTGVNSDIVMILHLDPTYAQRLAAVHSPRHLRAQRPRDRREQDRRRTLRRTESVVTAIEEDFGVPINNFVELNFDTFANVVNALGGIEDVLPHADL